MVELTDREIKIIHCMTTLINPIIKNVPQDVRNAMIMSTLKVRGQKFDEPELIDIINAITEETKMVVKNSFGLLARFKNQISEMGNVDLFKLS